MLGILLIYFLGKFFFDLAGQYDRNKWGFAIAGVVSYYFGSFVAGIMIGIYYEFYESTPIEEVNDLALNLMALPFGLLCCFAFYKILENSWKRKAAELNPDILDDELLD